MEKIKSIIMQVAINNNIKIDFNNLNTNLRDLGIDSLAALNLIVEIEDKVGFQLEDKKLMSIRTLKDLIEAFENN